MLGIEIAEIIDNEFRQRQVRLLDSQHHALRLEIAAILHVVRLIAELLAGIRAEGRVDVHAHRIQIDPRHADFLGRRHRGGRVGPQ